MRLCFCLNRHVKLIYSDNPSVVSASSFVGMEINLCPNVIFILNFSGILSL